MSITALIGGALNKKLWAHTHKLSGQKSEHVGLVVLTDSFRKYNPEIHPFLNDTFGAAMNQNLGYSGEPTIIHAGVNSGALLTGTTDGTTSGHLIDSGTDFTTGTVVVVGMSVKNTTSGNEYALVTAVASGDLTLDNDIFVSGEGYEINPIWVGTAVQGTWNFADSGKITLTSANDGDEASFDNDTNQLWNMANHTALTGKVDLDVFNNTNHTIVIQFDLAGTPVGNSVEMNNYFDVGFFTEQAFAIPKADFGLTTQNINGMTIVLNRSGGAKPTFKLDDLQWEETSSAEIYKSVTPQGTTFHVNEILVAMADAFTGIVTVAGATENHSMPGLSYDKLLGVSALSNGILLHRVQNGKTLFSATLRQLSDFLAVGMEFSHIPISDGTNTFITLRIRFADQIVIDGGADDNYMAFTVQDDLSGLLKLTAVARGSLEL